LWLVGEHHLLLLLAKASKSSHMQAGMRYLIKKGKRKKSLKKLTL